MADITVNITQQQKTTQVTVSQVTKQVTVNASVVPVQKTVNVYLPRGEQGPPGGLAPDTPIDGGIIF